jgi:predicted N-formylglutamate amidohydrolase
MHSFTPVFKGVTLPWHAGVLYNRDPRFAHILTALLNREKGFVIGDNECTASDVAFITLR